MRKCAGLPTILRMFFSVIHAWQHSFGLNGRAVSLPAFSGGGGHSAYTVKPQKSKSNLHFTDSNRTPYKTVCLFEKDLSMNAVWGGNGCYELLFSFLVIKPNRCTNFSNLFLE